MADCKIKENDTFSTDIIQYVITIKKSELVTVFCNTNLQLRGVKIAVVPAVHFGAD